MEITYSTKPLTLGQMADISSAGKGDYEATIRLIVGRTNLLDHQVRELDLEEGLAILREVTQAALRAMTLQNLGQQLDSMEGKEHG